MGRAARPRVFPIVVPGLTVRPCVICRAANSPHLPEQFRTQEDRKFPSFSKAWPELAHSGPLSCQGRSRPFAAKRSSARASARIMLAARAGISATNRPLPGAFMPLSRRRRSRPVLQHGSPTRSKSLPSAADMPTRSHEIGIRPPPSVTPMRCKTRRSDPPPLPSLDTDLQRLSAIPNSAALTPASATSIACAPLNFASGIGLAFATPQTITRGRLQPLAVPTTTQAITMPSPLWRPH